MSSQTDLVNENSQRHATIYLWYCGAIALCVLAVKLIIAVDVPASAMFSDDYSYLNKSIYYIRGDWSMRGYIFQNVFAGIVYPYLISPWMLIDGGPLPRLYFVFAINAVLSSITVYFGSLAIFKACGVRDWLTPICLAVFAPLFLMSFVVLTENLVFPLLALAAWLMVDIERLMKSRWRAALLLFTLALLPLVRAPALAVGIGACCSLLCSARRYGWKRTLTLVAMITIATVGPYLVVMYFAPVISKANTEKREAKYLRTIGDIFTEPARWWALIKLTLSQLSYITIATTGWGIAIILAYWMPLTRGGNHRAERRELGALARFCAFTATGFLAFACLHIGKKIKFRPGRRGFYVRSLQRPGGAACHVRRAVHAIVAAFRALTQCGPFRDSCCGTDRAVICGGACDR